MAMDKKALMNKIATAQVSGGGNNLRDGRGRLVIKKTALEDGFKGGRFVAEFIVVSSSKIPVVELKTGKSLDITPNQPGTPTSWVQMLEKHASAAGNVKGFVQEVLAGLVIPGEAAESGEMTQEEFLEAVGDMDVKNSAAGMVLDYETYRTITQEKGVEIVIPKWFRVEQTPADIQKMKTWMDSLSGVPTPGATTAAPAVAAEATPVAAKA